MDVDVECVGWRMIFDIRNTVWPRYNALFGDNDVVSEVSILSMCCRIYRTGELSISLLHHECSYNAANIEFAVWHFESPR